MPYTSSKMSLRVWNLEQDPYDHAQLADNWFRVDQHDHTPGRGVQIPTEGIADSAITQAKIAAGVQATPPDGSITLAKVAADLQADYDRHLAVWKPLGIERAVQIGAAAAAGTYAMPLMTINNAFASASILAFPFDPADYAIAGKTVQVRLKLFARVTGAAPTVSFTAGLRTVTATTTGGAQVAGTTASIATPAINTQTIAASAGTALGADFYQADVITSGSTAASSVTQLRISLQFRYV
jgi:hypothetical protein